MLKLSQPKSFCSEYGMDINEAKTFFFINGCNADVEPLVANGLIVRLSESYVYLGSSFTSDGSPTSTPRVYLTFKREYDIPFIVKQ